MPSACDGTYNGTELVLHFVRRAQSVSGTGGTIPTELGLLDQLSDLDLGANSDSGGLSGTIPTELGLLGQLYRLDLSANFLGDTLE